MRIGLLTREYPPEVYGGGGAHVGNLVPALRHLADVDVHGYGHPLDADPDFVFRHQWRADMNDANMALRVLEVNARMAASLGGVDVLHSHTWYTNMAGHFAKTMHGTPHVITAHSLEVRRPWKVEQLDSGYGVSSWIEDVAYRSADAVIAVSEWMRSDVLSCNTFLDPERVFAIRNGIDTTQFFPTSERSALARYGIDPARPIVLFVGRVSRQKGILPLLEAAKSFAPGAQIVLCAGAADTPELAKEAADALAGLRRARDGVFWIPSLHDSAILCQLFAAATVFVCPSVYEPMGIVNLEAMACATAVVASAVGGITEVVVDGETGLLVAYDPDDPAAHVRGLAASVNAVLDDPAWAAQLGLAGRKRAEEEFSWAGVARQTADVYGLVARGETR
jgi:alpha-maltose-1-phosphate synthase